MLRLTPNKLIDKSVLPIDKERINKGNTSIIYEYDAEHVEMFTIEYLKFQWLQHINVIDDYEWVTEAWYAGYKRNYYGKWTRLANQLDVYHAIVPKLVFPIKNKEIRNLQKLVWEDLRCTDRHEWWTNLYESNIPQLREPAEFALSWDSEYINPDFGYGDWAIVNDELVCVDPFHHEEMNKYFSLHKWIGNY